MDIRRTQDADALELLQNSVKNILHSVCEMMDMMVIPLCDLAKIKTFTTILEELQVGISTKESKKVSDPQ